MSEEGAMLQDMAEEYAVVADEKANAGLIVYGKFIGCDINPKAIEITKARLNGGQ